MSREVRLSPPVQIATYSPRVPKLWSETVEAHRRDVRAAILHTAAGLVAERGLAAVTMSQVAESVGIGRATLYKYFSDVESILLTWHEKQVRAHLDQLVAVRDQAAGNPRERLEAVLGAYAVITHERPHGTELAARVHRGHHLAHAQQELSGFIRDLVAQGAAAGTLRSDIPPEELATYCLHALAAASTAASQAAVQRLVTVTMSGLRPER
jgi:AcrR family transcriptional regulator